jgi:hypothetical protein
VKKRFISVSLVCVLLLCTSCAAPAVKTDASPAASGFTDGLSTGASAKPTAPADSGLTLENIKKAAESAGYAVEALKDYQQLYDPIPVGGFNLVYTDENTETSIPVYEFKSSDDALYYARQVNDTGYNLCIVSSKFLTMADAQYGVTTNDTQAGVLETLLQSQVMDYVEPAWVPLSPAKDFAGAYQYVDAIYKALDKLVNRSVLLHDKTAPEAAQIGTAGYWFMLLSSGDLPFLYNLCEDQAQLDAIVQMWTLFGCTDVALRHDKAHDYVLTGKRAGLDTSFELHCSYSPETGALRLIDTDGGEVIEFYEYVPLGNDTYAFQTLYSRAVVEFRDGKILSFVYAQITQGETPAYSPESDGIYENSAGVNEAWVSSAGADSYDQYITCDGTTLHIAADSFFDDNRLDVEIQVR